MPPTDIFDPNFDVATTLAEDYSVPRLFAGHERDALAVLEGNPVRPPFRWLLLGTAGTGSVVHTDPLGTSAWNASVVGRKRWAMFPPETPAWVVMGQESPEDADGNGDDDEVEVINALQWFGRVLPRARDAARRIGLECHECVQQPGDIVWVPGGWWHAVLNLETTVAVTQNLVPPAAYDDAGDAKVPRPGTFERAWCETRDAEPQTVRAVTCYSRGVQVVILTIYGRLLQAYGWRKALAERAPELLHRLDVANRRWPPKLGDGEALEIPGDVLTI